MKKKFLFIPIIILIILLVSYKIYLNIPSIPYKSTTLNLTLKFPKSWKNKYVINENKDALFIYFKPQKSNNLKGLLFIITDKNNKLIDKDEYDSIESKKYIKIKNKEYFIGAPTDIGFPNDNYEYSTYKKMKNQIPKILNSLT